MYELRMPEKADNIDVWGILEARYRDLVRLFDEVPNGIPVAALSYEALLEAPEPSLEKITEFLDLKSPLTSAYDVPRWGGTWGLGDGSEKIKSGRIEPKPRLAPASP